MRATLVIVLVLAALALVWVFGLTLNLFAGFGAILLAIAVDVVHKRQTTRPVVAVVDMEHSHGLRHQRRRAA
jgi:type IV secretory pathway TrbD component